MEKKHRIFIIQIIIMIKYYYETEFREDYSKKYKICNDFKVCFNHIFLLTTINIKWFLMVIFCPILLLIIIGLLVSQVYLIGSSKQQTMGMGAIRIQIIYYWWKSGFGDSDLENYYLNRWKNITFNNLKFNKCVTNKEIGKIIGRTKVKFFESIKLKSKYKTYYYYTTKVNGNGKNKDGHPYEDGIVQSLTILYIFDKKTNKNYQILEVFRKGEEDNDKKNFEKENATYY